VRQFWLLSLFCGYLRCEEGALCAQPQEEVWPPRGCQQQSPRARAAGSGARRGGALLIRAAQAVRAAARPALPASGWRQQPRSCRGRARRAIRPMSVHVATTLVGKWPVGRTGSARPEGARGAAGADCHRGGRARGQGGVQKLAQRHGVQNIGDQPAQVGAGHRVDDGRNGKILAAQRVARPAKPQVSATCVRCA